MSLLDIEFNEKPILHRVADEIVYYKKMREFHLLSNEMHVLSNKTGSHYANWSINMPVNH